MSVERTREERESLWWLVASPALWGAHLLAVYVTSAVYCAKLGLDAALLPARLAIVAYTVVAAAGIVATGIRGLRRHSFGDGTLPHDDDTPEDRYRFLGFATLLLSCLSLVAVLFVALPALFVETCR